MKKSRLLGAVCTCVLTLCFITSANAALVSRLGGQAAYDNMFGITWLNDADLNGLGNWDDTLTWIQNLNIANHLGFNEWRLAFP